MLLTLVGEGEVYWVVNSTGGGYTESQFLSKDHAMSQILRRGHNRNQILSGKGHSRSQILIRGQSRSQILSRDYLEVES
jgi:hypothetical protein